MQCSYCGSTSSGEVKFCESCGKPLGAGVINQGMQKTGKLVRSKDDRMIAGVAAGLANYFGMDPTIIRILWVLLTLAGGAGILIYILMAIFVPEE